MPVMSFTKFERFFRADLLDRIAALKAALRGVQRRGR